MLVTTDVWPLMVVQRITQIMLQSLLKVSYEMSFYHLLTLFYTVQHPVLTTLPSSQSVDLTQTATFTCSATGYNVSYNWTIGSGSFPSKVTGINTNTLVIPDVRSSDDNTYTCVASNEGGSVSLNGAKLTVTGMTMMMLLGDSMGVVLVVQVYQR